jgi:FKBP-type peptidyl-prolyl cis-trans isomerase FklB
MYSRATLTLLCLLLGTTALAQDGKPLKSDKDRLSYTLGHQIGQSLKRDGFDVDPAILAQAIGHVQSGAKPSLTEEEMRTVMASSREKRVQAHKEQAAKNLKASQEYLAANKAKKDVVSLPSGLQYKVLKAGSGDKPKSTDTVTVHYRGTLINGKEFDSSIARGQPATFPVNGVIRGWQEVLPLMPAGSKWQVFIPPDLAYGTHGAAGGGIGPNEALIFDIELIAIKK